MISTRAVPAAWATRAEHTWGARAWVSTDLPRPPRFATGRARRRLHAAIHRQAQDTFSCPNPDTSAPKLAPLAMLPMLDAVGRCHFPPGNGHRGGRSQRL